MFIMLTAACARSMRIFWWTALVCCFLIWAFAGMLFAEAQAAHCRKGQLYRVSMHRCVPAGSKLGREIRGRRYAKLEARETRSPHKRRFRRTRMLVEPQDEKAEWYADILLKDDGSLTATPRPDKPDEAGQTPQMSGTTANPFWPPNWADWYSPRRLTGP